MTVNIKRKFCSDLVTLYSAYLTEYGKTIPEVSTAIEELTKNIHNEEKIKSGNHGKKSNN